MNDELRDSKYWVQEMLVPRFKDLIDRLLKRLRTGILYVQLFLCQRKTSSMGSRQSCQGL